MGVPLNRIKPQDFAGQECIPLLFFPLNALALTDPDQPGLMQPFRADLDGNLLVSLGGTTGPILLPDNVDGVAPVAVNERLPTVARMYVFDDDLTEFNRYAGTIGIVWQPVIENWRAD